MENFLQTQLDNGIKVLASRQPGLHSACVGLYFRAGILYESKAKNGISHLLEHLFFRRLDDLSQRQLYYAMEAIGCTLRAKTYCNFIGFDLVVSPQYFQQAADIIARILHPFQWNEDEITREKAVVLKQIAYKSTPFGEYVDSLYFKGTKLSMPIMGTEETVKNLSAKWIHSYKDKFFNSRNACCVLTGNYTDKDYQYVLSRLAQIKAISSSLPQSALRNPVDYCKSNTDLKDSLFLVFQEIRKLRDAVRQEDLLQSIAFFTDNQNQLLDSSRDLNFLFGWQETIIKPKLFGIDPIVQKYSQVTIQGLSRSANDT